MLLFATMTTALDLVEELLEWRGLTGCPGGKGGRGVLRLDGHTGAAERGELVSSFNAPGKAMPTQACCVTVTCIRAHT